MGCGASKESTDTAAATICSRASCACEVRKKDLAGRSLSPRPQIVPSVRDSSSSPRPATDLVDTKLGSDLNAVAAVISSNFAAAAEVSNFEGVVDSSGAAEPVLGISVTSEVSRETTEVVQQTVVEYRTEVTETVEQTVEFVETLAEVVAQPVVKNEHPAEVVEHPVVERRFEAAAEDGNEVQQEVTVPVLDTSVTAQIVRAPSPSPPSPQVLCYSCQSVVEKLDESNVAVTINFSTSSLLAARRLSRTPSPAPRPQLTDSRSSTPNTGDYLAVAASPAPAEVHSYPVASVSAAESRLSSPSGVAALQTAQAALEESPNSTSRKLSRTPSPAPRPMQCESRSSTPKISIESRGSSPVTMSAAESKASSRAQSPVTAHTETESKASSPRQLLNNLRKQVSRSPSPAQIISQAIRHSSPASGAEIGKRHTSRSASPALHPEVLRKQSMPPDFPLDGLSKGSSKASLASLKDSKSSPAVSERVGKASSYSPSSQAGSRASSKSPALSRRASFGIGDEDNEYLSASAAAALKTIVQRVTSELAETSVPQHDVVRKEEEQKTFQAKKESVLKPEPGKEENNDELLSSQKERLDELRTSTNLETILSSVETKMQPSATIVSPKLGSKGHSPRPGLYEYYLGLRSGEYNMSPPSSSASSQNDALASIKDALDEIDISKDLVEENPAVTSKISSPTLDVESIYNEIRKLTFTEYEKLEQNDDSSSEVDRVSTTKAHTFIDSERIASPLSSKGSVEEGERLNYKLYDLLKKLP